MHTGTLGAVQLALGLIVVGAVIRTGTVLLARSDNPTLQSIAGGLAFVY